MMSTWKTGIATLSLGLATAVGSAWAQEPAREGGRAERPRPAAGRHHEEGDIPGPIDSVTDLQDTGKMLFKVADTNNDGQISQKEAIDAGNLLVGGFFFRADADGNGTLTQDEARQAREAMLRQNPGLRIVFGQMRRAARGEGDQGSNPAQGLASLLDGNQDRQLQAGELRQAVQTAVQGIYEAADTNRDGQMSPAEINAGVIGLARSAAQAAFQAADQDKNGSLSQEEFDRSIVEPAHAVFRMLDTDNDNQITPQEAQAARRFFRSQLRSLRVPEPANSPRNLIESGRNADEAAPVPAIGTPTPPARTAPRPAPAAAAPAPAQP